VIHVYFTGLDNTIEDEELVEVGLLDSIQTRRGRRFTGCLLIKTT
jgi:hypothetical protein